MKEKTKKNLRRALQSKARLSIITIRKAKIQLSRLYMTLSEIENELKGEEKE